MIDSRNFVILGAMGCGKTTLALRLVKLEVNFGNLVLYIGQKDLNSHVGSALFATSKVEIEQLSNIPEEGLACCYLAFENDGNEAKKLKKQLLTGIKTLSKRPKKKTKIPLIVLDEPCLPYELFNQLLEQLCYLPVRLLVTAQFPSLIDKRPVVEFEKPKDRICSLWERFDCLLGTARVYERREYEQIFPKMRSPHWQRLLSQLYYTKYGWILDRRYSLRQATSIISLAEIDEEIRGIRDFYLF